jgi:hypothetical protein
MDQIDAIEHLCAGRAGDGLTNAEELLVLPAYIALSQLLPLCRVSVKTHHLLVNPLRFVDKFVAELR